jgi:hypothetical protein
LFVFVVLVVVIAVVVVVVVVVVVSLAGERKMLIHGEKPMNKKVYSP